MHVTILEENIIKTEEGKAIADCMVEKLLKVGGETAVAMEWL